MRYVTKEFHYEIHPETREEVEQLKKEYPDLWPFKYVCVAFTKKDLERKAK